MGEDVVRETSAGRQESCRRRRQVPLVGGRQFRVASTYALRACRLKPRAPAAHTPSQRGHVAGPVWRGRTTGHNSEEACHSRFFAVITAFAGQCSACFRACERCGARACSRGILVRRSWPVRRCFRLRHVKALQQLHLCSYPARFLRCAQTCRRLGAASRPRGAYSFIAPVNRQRAVLALH